jgi:HD-like signal output (HDOD) protein/GGDEF domain-containing protein
MTDVASRLDRLIAKAGQLDSLPAVAAQILELTSRPEVDSAAVKACLEHDPALAAKVLRVVNSSLFGLTRAVGDLNQAVALLGIQPLKLLVLGFSLPERLFQDIAPEILSRYWRHTLTRAVAARELAESVGRQSGDEAFLAGLLEDLGILLLIKQLGPPYLSLLDRAHAERLDLAECERRSLGFDHAALTARMLDRWGLPDRLVVVVNRSDDLSDMSPETASLSRSLDMAELFARLLADGQTEALGKLLDLAEQTKLSADDVDLLSRRMEEKVQQLADIFAVRLPEPADYHELLLRAYRRLADEAERAAVDMVGLPDRRDGEEVDASTILTQVEELREGMQVDRDMPQANCLTPPAEELSTSAEEGKHDWSIDPGLEDRLALAVAVSRQSRRPVSLLLVELEHADDLVVRYGVKGFERILGSLESACRGLQQPHPSVAPMGDLGFAIVLIGCDRQSAVRMGNELIARARHRGAGEFADRPAVNLSAGVASVALPPKNFPAADLWVAARRCLYGSHASGGGVVKSIEIY